MDQTVGDPSALELPTLSRWPTSEAFLAYAGGHVPQASFEVGDARDLPFPDDALDVAAYGLVLNFVSDPPAHLPCVPRSELVVGSIQE
jgi:hypothetical protein